MISEMTSGERRLDGPGFSVLAASALSDRAVSSDWAVNRKTVASSVVKTFIMPLWRGGLSSRKNETQPECIVSATNWSWTVVGALLASVLRHPFEVKTSAGTQS